MPNFGNPLTGFVTNIEKDTVENKNFRKVLYTGKNSQLVLMSLKPGEDIGEEIHEDTDQFFRIDSGSGKVVINDEETKIKDGFATVIPQGAKHNVINTGEEDLKLYTVYSPPHHEDGTIHKTKEEAESSKEHFDGKTTELIEQSKKAFKLTKELDIIADEIEPQNKSIALAIDNVSDAIESEIDRKELCENSSLNVSGYSQYLAFTPSDGGEYYTLRMPNGTTPPREGSTITVNSLPVVVFNISTPEEIGKGRGGSVARSMIKNGIAWDINCLPIGHEYLRNPYWKPNPLKGQEDLV